MSNLFSIFYWTTFNKSFIISEIKSGKYDLDMVDETGKTILMYAALMWEYDTNDIVSLLIEFNVNINIQDSIENNLILLGCSAVEDKLQDRVPEVIHNLLRGGRACLTQELKCGC